jgi:hypothetical protein
MNGFYVAIFTDQIYAWQRYCSHAHMKENIAIFHIIFFFLHLFLPFHNDFMLLNDEKPLGFHISLSFAIHLI